ncbi:MAG: hypothetical protein R6U04_05495, partial [Bacteroidales bacterium]
MDFQTFFFQSSDSKNVLAKERRINKIIQVADEAEKELRHYEIQNRSNNEYIEEISQIREAYK